MHQFTKNALSAWLALSLAVLPVSCSGLGWAEEAERPIATVAAAAKPVSAPIAAKGMRAYRDPKTGRLAAPAPGIQPPGLSIAEQQMLNRSDRGLRARTLPNGAVAVDLQGRFMSMAVATTRAGGTPAVSCSLTPQEAKAALQSGIKTRVRRRNGE